MAQEAGMRGWRLVLFVVITAAIVWLMRTSDPPRPLHPIRPADPVASDLGSAFDSSRTGSVSGHVRWVGSRPTVDPIKLTQVPSPPGGKTEIANPNAPDISDDNGVADAVVFLSGVDTARSMPWPHSPVTVEVDRDVIAIRQGSSQGRYGVVRRGTEVEFVTREAAALHTIRGRGPSFFTQMIPTPDQPVRRVLAENGVVELSSGSGYFWLRGYLVVSDHPYVGITGSDGSFRFDSVPDGEYDIICWKANWQIDRLERDPEWLGPVRLYFRPPVQIRQRVAVKAGGAQTIDFALSAADAR
jgi:hypothetical protein